MLGLIIHIQAFRPQGLHIIDKHIGYLPFLFSNYLECGLQMLNAGTFEKRPAR